MDRVIENFVSRRARGWRVPWVVYRDGERWSVSAVDMHEALDLAQRVPRNIGEAAIMRGEKTELYVREGTSVESCRAPEDLRRSLVCIQLCGRGVGFVYLPSPQVLYVLEAWRPWPSGWLLMWRDVLDVAEALDAQLQAAKAEPTQYVAVSLYRSGKREGLPRFSREHDETYRAQVVDAIEHNAARLRRIEVEELCLSKTLECLPTLGEHASEDVERFAISTLETVGEQLERVKVLAGRSECTVAVLDWLTQTSISAARALANARSVHDHGFGVGSRCVLPESEHGDEPHGPGIVLGVAVSHEGSAYGPGVKTLHERHVHLDGVGEVWANVCQLRLR